MAMPRKISSPFAAAMIGLGALVNMSAGYASAQDNAPATQPAQTEQVSNQSQELTEEQRALIEAIMKTPLPRADYLDVGHEAGGFAATAASLDHKICIYFAGPYENIDEAEKDPLYKRAAWLTKVGIYEGLPIEALVVGQIEEDAKRTSMTGSQAHVFMNGIPINKLPLATPEEIKLVLKHANEIREAELAKIKTEQGLEAGEQVASAENSLN